MFQLSTPLTSSQRSKLIVELQRSEETKGCFLEDTDLPGYNIYKGNTALNANTPMGCKASIIVVSIALKGSTLTCNTQDRKLEFWNMLPFSGDVHAQGQLSLLELGPQQPQP